MPGILLDFEVSFDTINFNWAHGIILGLTCLSLLAVTINKYFEWKSEKRNIDKVNMVKVDIPFTIVLEEEQNVRAIVTSAVANRVEIYWNADIGELHDAMEKPWSDKSVLDSDFCMANTADSFERGEKYFILGKDGSAPGTTDLRPTYPAVVVIRNLRRSSKKREALGLITTFTFKEPGSTQLRILGHYLKLGSGKVIALQRYFPSGLYQDGTTDLCVVCRDSPVTRVVLPCRHACYCSPCLNRVTNCSMCTGNIETYFCIEPAFDDVD